MKKKSIENKAIDEIYELFRELKKRKMNENREEQKKKNKKKKNGIALKNVQISTPAMMKKTNNRQKQLLDFGISPIKSSTDEIDENRAMNKLVDSLRKERLKEIKEQEKLLETSAILRAKALLEKYKNPNPTTRLKLPQQDSHKIAKRLSLNDSTLISSTINENDVKISSSQDEKKCDKIDENSPSASKKQKVDHSESQLINNKFMETLHDVVNKKSVNFAESKVTFRKPILRSSSKRSNSRVSSDNESRVSTGNVSLHPGKWRRALIEFRKAKSSILNTIIHERDQEDDEEYQKASIYSNKIVDTLGECEYLLFFIFNVQSMFAD